jgi:hypothetical protein
MAGGQVEEQINMAVEARTISITISRTYKKVKKPTDG